MRIKTCALVLSALASLTAGRAIADGPTVQEYVNQAGNGTKVVPPGSLIIDGKRMVCGKRSVVLDPNLDDYGAAYSTFLIINPRKLARVPRSVKFWIFSHECAHQFRGPDESVADCFAVQRGRRQGWLTQAGLEEICRFINPAQGDSMHYTGPERCSTMRKCFGEKKIY